METASRLVRATIRAARGDVEDARLDIARAVEMAREVGDPQTIQPVLAWAAYLTARLGAVDEARALVGELSANLADGAEGLHEPWYSSELAPAIRLCRADSSRFMEVFAADSPWFRAALAFLEEDFERAADLWHDIGMLPAEATARVAAAEVNLAAGRRARAAEQLGRALAFYRQVGAPALIAEAERLLPAAS
jgi:hypothetical protein